MRWIGLVISIMFVSPASADQIVAGYTLTDDQYETLVEHTKIQNKIQERSKKKGMTAIALTPEQVFKRDVDGLIRGWDHFQSGTDESTVWADKSPRAKRRFCERQGLAKADCPK